MARKVIWAYAAEEDLEAAASYIHRDSPVYAASFIDRKFWQFVKIHITFT